MLGLFFNEYRNETFYWEFIKIFERTLISFVLIFFGQDVIIKGLLCAFITLLYSNMARSLKPYKDININRIDYISSDICCITLALAVFLNKNENKTIQMYLIWFFIIVLNSTFFINLFYNLWNTLNISSKFNDKI